ncbi:hypothetical protein CsSME_00045744 [Camellia sinensis var. sinensis]
MEKTALSLSSSSSFQLPSNFIFLISNLSFFVTVKLDSSNFIIWKNQLSNILRATSLLYFVDGSSICPPKLMHDSNNKEVPNPCYASWILVNSHLMITRSKSHTSPHTLALSTVVLPSIPTEPTSYKEVASVPTWTVAVMDEFQALQN